MSHKVGQAIYYWILPASGIVILCTTVQRLTRSDKATDECKAKTSDYNTNIVERLEAKNSDLTLQAQGIDLWNKLSIAEEDPEFLEELNRVISDSRIPDGPDDNVSDSKEGPTPVPVIHDQETVPIYAYVDMDLWLPCGEDDSLMHAIVKLSKIDDDGNPIGTESTNPLVDTRAYEIECIDGTTKILIANIIAKNLLEQVDEEVHRQLLLDDIIKYRRNNDAVHKIDAFIKTSTGNRQRKLTTKGW